MRVYEETITQLDNKDFLDKLYAFAYKRCNNSYEAEELCSLIILSVINSIYKNPHVENFYAFTWTVARRVYADFCEHRRKQLGIQSLEDYHSINLQSNPIDELIEQEDERFYLNKIMNKITFLSKIYRDVMVMYYLDELKIAQIAHKLNISESTVKQRLFSARNTIKQEVKKMNTPYTLKPMDIAFIGTGTPTGNDPRKKAERMLSKNLVYLCKNTALSIKEMSEKLNVPMPFIEDEVDIQLRGENGSYGLLRKLDNGKYISNIILIDIEDYHTATATYQNLLDELCDHLIDYLKENQEKILAFPFLNKQTDIKFITWSLISRMAWAFENAVNQNLKLKHFINQETTNREFSVAGITYPQDTPISIGFYGCDGISGENLCGYSMVHLANIYGKRIEKHFDCGHNISTDPQLLLTLKAIEGVDINTLSEKDKELAAKAIKNGYLQKNSQILTPKILVIDQHHATDFYNLSNDFSHKVAGIAEQFTAQLAHLIKKLVPNHLLDDYPLFCSLTNMPVLHGLIEKCIEKDILIPPKETPCAEGTWMIVSK